MRHLLCLYSWLRNHVTLILWTWRRTRNQGNRTQSGCRQDQCLTPLTPDRLLVTCCVFILERALFPPMVIQKTVPDTEVTNSWGFRKNSTKNPDHRVVNPLFEVIPETCSPTSEIQDEPFWGFQTNLVQLPEVEDISVIEFIYKDTDVSCGHFLLYIFSLYISDFCIPCVKSRISCLYSDSDTERPFYIFSLVAFRHVR